MTESEKTVFQNLNSTQIENFMAACEDRRYGPGDLLITRGASGNKVFFLREGNVRVFISEGKHERELAILGPPAVVGEMELLTGKPRAATVAAVGDVHALAMPFDVLKSRMQDGDPATLKVISNIAVVLAHRLSATLDQLTKLENAPGVEADELEDFRKKLFSDWTF